MNIFTNLLRCRSNSREDFLTELFAALLREWYRADSGRCCAFLEDLFDVKPSPEEKVNFVTQYYAGEDGRPDLCVKSSGSLLILENKWDAEPDWEQLKSYKRIPEKERKKGRVILTTVRAIEPSLCEEIEKDESVRHFLWYQIHDKLKKAFEEYADEEPGRLCYLHDEFMDFMREEGMTIEVVRKDLVAGIRALNYLLKQIEKVLVDKVAAPGSVNTRRTNDWVGCSFNLPEMPGPKFWVWIYWDSPGELFVDVEGCKPELKNKLVEKLESASLGGNPCDRIHLDEKFFDAAGAEEQMERLGDFVKNFLGRVKKVRDEFSENKTDPV